MTRSLSHLSRALKANISRFFHRPMSLFSQADFVRRSFLSADFVFVSRFRQQIFVVSRSSFCQQIL
jgi:hypothetical protein